MFNQLRNKFILVAMCSTLAVLTVIVGTMNIVSYRNIVKKADAILEMLAENDGRFPMEEFSFRKKDSFSEEEKLQAPPKTMGRENMSPETPYETRFFSVRLKDSGEVTAVDTGKIAAIETEDAIIYAKAVWTDERKKGFYESYRFQIVPGVDDNVVIFVDMGRDLSTFQTLLTTSISISAAGLMAVFILVVIFSKKVFRPVAASYEKQKQFITDASHELKTPLTIISANVEVLELEAGESSWTRSIQNQIERMNKLIEQMVTLSRMDENKSLQNAGNFSLSEAVEQTAELYEPLARSQEKQLTFHIEEDATYWGDEASIRQLISLLMDNAMKYSPKQGKIEITLRRRGKHFEILVWNTVEEIQKGNLDILFERFYRLDSSRSSDTGGSGIGLSIAKAIVEAHKGRITAKSEDGKSIQFFVVL